MINKSLRDVQERLRRERREHKAEVGALLAAVAEADRGRGTLRGRLKTTPEQVEDLK